MLTRLSSTCLSTLVWYNDLQSMYILTPDGSQASLGNSMIHHADEETPSLPSRL